MTEDEIRAHIKDLREARAELGEGYEDAITLTIWRPEPPKHETMRLTSRGGPSGQVLSVNKCEERSGYHIRARFDCTSILNMLDYMEAAR